MKTKLAPSLAAFLIAVFLPACAMTGIGNDKADQVQITDKVESYKCKFIDVVIGSSESEGNDADFLFESAMRKARNNAANKNATHLILQGTPQSQFDPEAKAFRMTLVANAYQCKK